MPRLRPLFFAAAGLLAFAETVHSTPGGTEESSRELGGGFRDVTLAVKNKSGSLELYGHFRYLFHKANQIARTDQFVVAPSGKFAVYQDSASQDIYLVEADGEKKTLLRKSPRALVQAFHWNDDEKSAEAELEGGVDLTLELPARTPVRPPAPTAPAVKKKSRPAGAGRGKRPADSRGDRIARGQ
jgi:hypothetical protein